MKKSQPSTLSYIRYVLDTHRVNIEGTFCFLNFPNSIPTEICHGSNSALQSLNPAPGHGYSRLLKLLTLSNKQ